MKNITKAHSFFITGFMGCFYGYLKMLCCSALSGNYRVVNLQLLGLPGVQSWGACKAYDPAHPPCRKLKLGKWCYCCCMCNVKRKPTSICINSNQSCRRCRCSAIFFYLHLKVWNSAYCARRFRLRGPLTRSFFCYLWPMVATSRNLR